MRWAQLAVCLVGVALACGRYGAPIRPAPQPPAPPTQEPVPQVEPAAEPAEPDFRLDLPGLNGDEEDE